MASAGRRLAIFDIDGTLTDGFLGMAYCAFLTQRGLLEETAGRALAATLADHLAGRIDYRCFLDGFGRYLSAGLRGRAPADVLAVGDAFFESHRHRLRPFAAPLVALFNERGFFTVALSGSPIELLWLLQRRLGFGHVIGTVCQVADGRYSGRLMAHLGYEEAKRASFEALIVEVSADVAASFGFGDTLQDLAFLERVGHPVVIGDNAEMAAVAAQRAWLRLGTADDVVARLLERLGSGRRPA